MLDLTKIQPLIDMALAEDIADGDKTSLSIIPPDQPATAVMTAKAYGILAGMPVADQVFKTVDPTIEFIAEKADGDRVQKGEVIAQISGSGPSLLTAERLALNFLQRMSGVATTTAVYVQAVAGTDAKVLDTRKTLPGHRLLDKYAVKIGGGANHRMGLFDMIMIKDNHIDVAGSITKAVARARAMYQAQVPIEVEARTLDDVREALKLNVDQIMLDNMKLDIMREAVKIVDGQIPLEASGGVTLDTISDIAKTGVDFISVGALTHSIKAFDISMTINIIRNKES